jgi:predicted dinucleotide-binding enzyme
LRGSLSPAALHPRAFIEQRRIDRAKHPIMRSDQFADIAASLIRDGGFATVDPGPLRIANHFERFGKSGAGRR